MKRIYKLELTVFEKNEDLIAYALEHIAEEIHRGCVRGYDMNYIYKINEELIDSEDEELVEEETEEIN